MTASLAAFPASLTQVLPLCAVVFPEFTLKRQTHRVPNIRMANDTLPDNPSGKSLEITLRDCLDGLEDFTLQMAYATTHAQFEILAIGDVIKNKNDLPAKPAPLTLVTASINNNHFQPTIRRQRRV